MVNKRKIIDAKSDKKGNISHVKLQGNSSFTPIKTAIDMAKQGKVDAIVVNPSDKKEHLRTRPDGKEKNNLDHLADK